MLNDWYQAIIDTRAPLDEAQDIAIAVTTRLAAEKIITIYKPDEPQTHISGKFAPGPLFSHFSDHAAVKARQPGQNLGGMDVFTKPWVNDYGIVGLDFASCPMCLVEFSIDRYDQLTLIKESFANAGDIYMKQRRLTDITCPGCGSTSPLTEWYTQPHLGFCNLAFIFWNWPPFENWTINVPAIITEIIGRRITLTYGRL